MNSKPAKYDRIVPVQSPIPADRQNAKRHYGVHPYFTRRPADVVRQYVLHYSKENDLVLDPFGGSGVTAIEAFLENRLGVQNDINPLANFIAEGIVRLENGKIPEYEATLAQLREQCQNKLEELQTVPEVGVENLLSRLRLPANIELPKTSDVRNYHELFSTRQLAALGHLRQAIDKISNEHSRNAMLLAWSATLAKLNRTFLSAEGRAESRGGSSIFSIYRYKIAKQPVELPAWKTFEERARNVIAAKSEIDKSIDLKRRTNGWSGKFQAYALDVEELALKFAGKADYIFTDPPYGGHISYLDLSTLWNHWLGSDPSKETRRRELIVGGELHLTETDYSKRLAKSIECCIAMLKPNRRFSVVFQHWNPTYFDAILSAACETGGDLRSAVAQVGDPIWSMHKKKGNESVLAGEMILTFCKTGRQKQKTESSRAFDIEEAVADILTARRDRVMYGEDLFNKLIVSAWNHNAINSLSVTKTEFNNLIRKHSWQYDEQNHFWVRGSTESSLFQ